MKDEASIERRALYSNVVPNAAGQMRAPNFGTFACHTFKPTPKQAKEPTVLPKTKELIGTVKTA